MRDGEGGEGMAELLVRLALLAFPGSRRERFGEEMRRDVAAAVRTRCRRDGRLAAASYLVRALLDTVRAGLGERLRPGSAGDPGRAPLPESDAGSSPLGGLGGDVRHALRGFRRAPGFAVAAVVVLALGIGANTAVFSALRTVLLAPPPYPEPERMVLPKITWSPSAGAPSRTMPWSWPKFEMLRESTADHFAVLAAHASRSATLSEPGQPDRIDVEIVTPEYFAVLGVRPRQGRTFTEAEGVAGDPRGVALVSHGLWTSRFGGDPGAVGRRIVLNGVPLTVVGILPQGFEGLGGGTAVWVSVSDVPGVFSAWMMEGSGSHWLHALGRLRPAVPPEAARERVRGAGEEIAEAFARAGPAVWGTEVTTFEQAYRNPSARTSVLVLSAAAALVFLIAVANLASLLLARARNRRRETAVRLALGAGRWRIVRAAAVESFVLAVAGGLAGLVVAYLGTETLRGAWPSTFLRSVDDEFRVVDVAALGLDGPTLLFALATALLAGVLFGVLPSLRQAGIGLVPSLKEGQGATRPAAGSGGRGAPRWWGGRRLLVAAQSALALVLLVGAALMLATLARLQSVERGFEGGDILVFRYTVPEGEGPREFFHQAYLGRLRGLPGVTDAALAGSAPLSGYNMVTIVQELEGRPDIRPGEEPSIAIQIVEPGFFEALGIRTMDGRTLRAGDAAVGSAPDVAVISTTAARELFGDVDPVGRTFRMGISFGDGPARYRVLGVVEDVLFGPPERGFMPVAYLPLSGTDLSSVTALVRTTGEPFDLVPLARAALAELDPALPIYGITTLEDLEAEITGDTRVVLWLLGLFAGVALLLTGTGLYAVVAHAVADRRRELGLRMALGARSAQVAGMVLRQGLATAAGGMALGAAGAWGATRLLQGLLYEVSTTDPRAFGGAIALLMLVAAVASWLPARRATRLDPMETLRAE